MDWSQIVSLISSVGFPIVACIYIFKYMQKQDEAHREDIQHLTEIVNNNTNVMNQLIQKIDNLIR